MAVSRRQLMAGAAAAAAAPAVLGAEPPVVWKMVTSWPRNFPGPGTGAQRLADRVAAMSAGRLQVKLYAAGELVPGLGVFDAVAAGNAELGHSASFFWRGKAPASVFFTTVPFGLSVGEHAAWIEFGGGQALWDEVYAPFGLRAFMAGNSGMQMGGWFRRPIERLDDLRGLKYRIPGLGGETLKRLGVTPVLLAPGDIYGALQAGTVDGAEFLGPWSDLAAGFYKVARFYHWPGFHEPNGTAECLVNAAAFDALDEELRQIFTAACAAENAQALAETEWRNAQALARLASGEFDVEVRAFPDDVLRAARTMADEVVALLAGADPLTRRVHDSYVAARATLSAWSDVSLRAYLNARGG